MAGYVVRRRLEKPAPHTSLLEGLQLWRWEEGDNTPQKVLVQVDKDGFYLFARGEDKSKEASFWDLALVSDVRAGKLPKDQRLQDPIVADVGQLDQDACVTLMYRRDGIVNLTATNFVAQSPENAQIFRKSVNELAHHLLDSQASLHTYFRKLYTKTLLHANGHGLLSIKTLSKLMMLRPGAKDVSEYLITHRITKDEEYVDVKVFTLDVFLGLVDKLLQSRGPDLDEIKKEAKVKANRQYLTMAEFQTFLNENQRDPRLNEILHPRLSKEQVVALVEKYGSGKERLNLQSLMSYLVSDDNIVLNPEGIDQHMDMSQPLNYYFINSSHNTYLNGGQWASESLAEMYAQTLLCGCRCVELDCWPSDDKSDIVITHGNTFCTKVLFQDCVEAINEFAFVSSDYPVILSIENHCNRYPNLIAKMATTFVTVFGDKLQSTPFDDIPLEPGVTMPPLERLKRKILIKDKVRRPGKGGGTLQRGATITIEEPPVDDSAKNGNGSKNGSKNGSESTDGNSDVESSGKTDASKSVGAAAKPKSSLLVQRPSLLKGMTILEEPVEKDEQVAKEARSDVPVILEEESTKQAEEKPKVASQEPSQEPLKEKEVKEEEKSKEPAGDESKLATPSTPSSATPKKEKYETGGVLDSGPLSELLNYATAISFVSFEVSEKMNCHYVMSSFNEEKGLNLIKTVPKDFVRYNGRQNSRVYPIGSRINSSNYMPQIYWNVGCQMVALNFQTPDLPMQINYAKYELNGGTGYILKPWVMCADKGFNPFVQKKIEDIVPCRLEIKVISGLFLTDKRTNLMVEAEMYGLPADTVRRQFTKKKAPAPHPMWNEGHFVFKRILLPEMALLRLAVIDDDHALVGQRILPMNHLRAGFRHISLRDKHNQPLGVASLFVHIKVEDYVPDEMEEFVAALMDPLSFASSALLALAEGTGVEGETDETDAGAAPTPDPSSVGSLRTPAVVPSASPRRSLGNVQTQKTDANVPPELMTQSKAVTQAFSKTPRASTQDDTLPFIQAAKHREAVLAVKHNSSVILQHSDYLKTMKKSSKLRTDLAKKHDKARSTLQSKHAKELKGKVPADKVSAMKEAHTKALAELEAANKQEVYDFDVKSLAEQHEKQRFLMEATHKAQRAQLDKSQQGDIKQVNIEVLNEMKKKRKSDEYSMKDGKRFIHEEMVRMGTTLRSELDAIHRRETQQFEKSVEEAIKEMTDAQKVETEKMRSSEQDGASS